MSEILIKRFDETSNLIIASPDKENTIINEYINLIIETNNTYKPMVRSSTFKDDNIPFDITIHNNFQRYNNDFKSIQDQQETPASAPAPAASASAPAPAPAASASASAPAPPAPQAPATPETFNNYFRSFNEGFKDYYAFNK